MQFLKKNYEKIILGVVLLLVAGVSLMLTVRAGQERQLLADNLERKVTGTGKKAVKAVDLDGGGTALEHLSTQTTVSLAGNHKTFNPDPWVRKADGSIFPVADNGQKGARGLVLTETKPLSLSITFTAVTGTGEPYHYQFVVVRDYERQASKRRPMTVTLDQNGKSDLFTLPEVHGPKDNPTDVVIELIDTGERVTLIKDKTFSKTGLAFAADLRYEVENKTFPGKRQDESVTLAGVNYKIVAIGKDEVVVSAPNQVRTVIKLISPP